MADNARATRSTINEDILKLVLEENGEIDLSPHVLFILHQRLPSLRNRISQIRRGRNYDSLDAILKFPDSCGADLQNEYWKLLLTGKCRSKQWKEEAENLMRKAAHLQIPNGFKTDMKVDEDSILKFYIL